MAQNIAIAPSILSADLMELQRDVALIAEAGADYIHVDVMDGHFVPNITFGVPTVRQLSRITDIPLDVHLMVSNPLEQLPWFIEAGADILTVHGECLTGQWADRAVHLIHDGGAKACVAVKPHTSLEILRPIIGELDMVLIMSVEPGFSGQSFIEGSEERVAAVAAMRKAAGAEDLLIEIDGGIDEATVGRVCAAGADVIVCGNAVFGSADPASAMAEIRHRGEEAHRGAL